MHYSPWWAAVGLAFIILSVYDFYVTTVTTKGSGSVSRRFARTQWRGFLSLHRHRSSHKLLSTAGPLLMLQLIVFWFGLCWLGWFLIFCASESSVVYAQTGRSATIIERVYYAGYTITTIGYGDFRSGHPTGQIGSIVAGLNGLFLVTLAITYTPPVVSAAVEKRQLAVEIAMMGASTKDILKATQGDGDYRFLASQLQRFNSRIAGLSQKHLAYPILHYFHSTDLTLAFSVNLARLYEATSLVLASRTDLPKQTELELMNAQKTVEHLLETLSHSFVGQAREAPPLPNISSVAPFELAGASREQVAKALSAKSSRAQLLAFVHDDGWTWTDVAPGGE